MAQLNKHIIHVRVINIITITVCQLAIIIIARFLSIIISSITIRYGRRRVRINRFHSFQFFVQN